MAAFRRSHDNEKALDPAADLQTCMSSAFWGQELSETRLGKRAAKTGV